MTKVLPPLIKQVRRRLATAIMRARTRNRDFVIISNDCWGAEVYRELGLPYRTPFVGLFMVTPCFMRLLDDLWLYLDTRTELRFIRHSRYPSVNDWRQKQQLTYPMGLLVDSVELHFLHYDDPSEAASKWFRRLSRIEAGNTDQIFVKFSADKDLCTEADVRHFEALPFAHKLCLAAQPYPGCRSVVSMPDYDIDGAYMYWLCRRYFDVAGWLNGKTHPDGLPERLLNTVLYYRY